MYLGGELRVKDGTTREKREEKSQEAYNKTVSALVREDKKGKGEGKAKANA